MKKNGGDVWLKLAMILALLTILYMIRVSIESSEYNSGICKNCGGEYEYVSKLFNDGHTNYIYKCNRCGKTLLTRLEQPN